MKKLTKVISIFLLSLFILNSWNSNGQKKKKTIETVTYKQLYENELKSYKNTILANEYINKDGISFKVGDTIVIGKPSNKNSLETSSVISGAKSNMFSYVSLGSGASIFLGAGFMATEYMSGDKGKIHSIKIVRIDKNNPYKAFMTMRSLKGKWLGIKRDANTNIDLAFDSGEILKDGFITKEQAIAELKKAKELLDLELITQDEYDKKKKELRKYILKKN